MPTFDQIGAILSGSAQRAPWGWVLTVVVIGMFVKVWPIIQLQTLKAKAALRNERREDLSDCQEQLEALRGDLAQAVERIHNIELRLVGTLTAYRILEADAEQHRPGSSALHQAQAAFRQVWDTFIMSPGDMVETVLKAN